MKSTPEMRARIRELMTEPQDDYDRAVECVLDDLEAILSVAQGSPDRDAIARIIDPDCADALITERKWCEQYNKHFETFAQGYIRRWEHALAKADAILALPQATGKDGAREAAIEECAKVAEEEARSWINGEATTTVGQAFQRASRQIALKIRALALPSTRGNTP